ncbi:SGNH/GDSL hydrolase family protein [Streptomyces sp. NPDC088789]|uniref:SGNH/GDSL hydrolase family protein n=1 Tax=Streptomyces sp. NPDC088789 TaxID=3365899 RepID=UPI0037F96BD0
MTRSYDDSATASRARQNALLAALLALVVAVSAGIYAGVASDDGRDRPSAAGRHPRQSAAPASTGVWVGAWSASPAAAEPGTETGGLAGRSLRNVVHTGAGGSLARITLSNLYGQQPLTVTHASIALAAADDSAAAAAGTMRRVTFGGRGQVVVPPGQQRVSDPVELRVPHEADVLVTTYSPTGAGPVTYHPRARQISYAARGDRTADLTGAAYAEQVEAWRYLSALDVLSHESDGTVVVLGDSLTAGATSTVGANRRWTDVLSRRLREAVRSGADLPRYSVVNQGISGNRVLANGPGRPADNPSGLNRFARDVLGRPQVKVVVIDLGINDILRHPGTADAEAILAGLRALVDQAHGRGVKVVGATLMPFRGHRGYTAAREEVRQRINAEIREGRVFDAVVDFDAAVRDAYDPRRLRGEYDCGDRLHPSDEGYARMGEAVELGVLRGAAPVRL